MQNKFFTHDNQALQLYILRLKRSSFRMWMHTLVSSLIAS